MKTNGGFCIDLSLTQSNRELTNQNWKQRKEVASKTIAHTVPAVFTIDESLDVGVDTRSSVEEKDYQGTVSGHGKARQANDQVGAEATNGRRPPKS